MTSHLLGLGHTRIAMVCGLPGLSTTDERRRGFEVAHEAADVEVDLTLVIGGQGTVAGAEAAARAMLQRSDPPSAIVSGNNAMTIGIMSAARDAHMRVPEDLALVCFDDFEWADLFKPRLTAIAQPIEEMANRAVEMLRTRAADADEPYRRELLVPRIMHRDSCGCGHPGPADWTKLSVRARERTDSQAAASGSQAKRRK
jgi:LacI family transcriptional regulator